MTMEGLWVHPFSEEQQKFIIKAGDLVYNQSNLHLISQYTGRASKLWDVIPKKLLVDMSTMKLITNLSYSSFETMNCTHFHIMLFHKLPTS